MKQFIKERPTDHLLFQIGVLVKVENDYADVLSQEHRDKINFRKEELVRAIEILSKHNL